MHGATIKIIDKGSLFLSIGLISNCSNAVTLC